MVMSWREARGQEDEGLGIVISWRAARGQDDECRV